MFKFKDYHIIVVPKDRAKTKSFKVSGFSLKVLMISVILSIPLFLVSVLSTVHYQNKLVALKRKTFENQKLLQSKKQLVVRLKKIEKSLTLIDDTILNLGKVMDIDPQSLKTGLGPITDVDTYLMSEDGSSDLVKYLEHPDETLDEWVDKNGDLTVGKFSKRISNLKGQSKALNKKLEQIYQHNKDKIRFVTSMPTGMPVDGWVTSEFGMRKHPIRRSYKMHYGIDVASPYGTKVVAPADGLVIYTGRSGGHGNIVIVDHGYGVTSLYAHLSEINTTVGTKVKHGDLLAKVGSTGASTGPHLHYEVRVDGIPTDPMAYVMK